MGIGLTTLRRALVLMIALLISFGPAAPRVQAAPASVAARIGGGTAADPASVPWMVQLLIAKPVNGRDSITQCGGALLSDRIVLTAAHCITGASRVTAYFGRSSRTSGGVAVAASGIAASRNFKPTTYENDSGIVVLSRRVTEFTPIQLAGAGEEPLSRPGRVATVVGFGATSTAGTLSPTLQQVQVPVLPDRSCSSPSAYGSRFTPLAMLCAGVIGRTQGTCAQDGGGPLVAYGDNGVVRLVGVVSVGDTCNDPSKPSIYTRVAGPGAGLKIIKAIGDFLAANPSAAPEGTQITLGVGAVPLGCTAARERLGRFAKTYRAYASLAGRVFSLDAKLLKTTDRLARVSRSERKNLRAKIERTTVRRREVVAKMNDLLVTPKTKRVVKRTAAACL